MGRRRQRGSVRRLASGRYHARLPDGSPAPDTFPTKAEASRWLALAEADLVRGTFVHPSLNANVTVAEWLEEWRASHSLHKRPTTLARDESAIRRQLIPRLGDIQLAKLADRRPSLRRRPARRGRTRHHSIDLRGAASRTQRRRQR
jgi:hypothetical protein